MQSRKFVVTFEFEGILDSAELMRKLQYAVEDYAEEDKNAEYVDHDIFEEDEYEW